MAFATIFDDVEKLERPAQEDEVVAPSLKLTFKSLLPSSTTVRPLTSAGYVRASALAGLCPREEVLAARHSVVRTNSVSSDLAVIFAHGHGLHWAFQNILLPMVGILRGKWVCTSCALTVGEPVGDQRVVDAAVPRPSMCSRCMNEDFLFQEYNLVDHEYRITGHSDGFLAMEGMDGLGVFEGKSINPRGAWEVADCPKMDHVIQIQLYMWLTGLNWGKLVYWDKAGVGMSSFIEHTIMRDDDVIQGIKDVLQAMWAGIDGDGTPERICTSADCPRASSCALAVQCFGE